MTTSRRSSRSESVRRDRNRAALPSLAGRRRRAVAALRILKSLHSKTQAPGRDPATGEDAASSLFQVLVSTMLSHRTRDEMTAVASRALFDRFPDAPSLARAPLPAVRRLIRPVGFYNSKAKRVREVARILLRDHSGKVPEDIDTLVTLPGVGRKTAGCVLVYGLGVPAIPVDTHVHRISNRLGLVRTRTPEETEEALAGVLPREWWLEVNELLVTHGREVCRPIGPRCERCPVAECPSRRRPFAG